MIDGHCALNLFLNPFFMHLPSPVEMRPWYPGLGDSQKNILKLISALAIWIQLNPGATRFDPASRIIPGRRLIACSVYIFEVVRSDPAVRFNRSIYFHLFLPC